MSLSYQPLMPVMVRDPRTDINSVRDYAILRSGKNVLWKTFTTTNVSVSSIQFSCPPSAANIIVQRKIWFYLPVRLTFTGTTGAGNLLKAGFDAPRAHPISGSIDTLKITINGVALSVNMADVVHPLMHFNTDEKLKNRDYSATPVYPDQSQVYSSLAGANFSIRNPLAPYGDSLDESVIPRGGFPFNIVSNTPTSAVVDMALCEELYCSPLQWGHGNDSGFFNVNQMDFNINFVSNVGNRMWSHDTSGGSTITNISASFNTANFTNSLPTMLFQYIEPDELQMQSALQPITYPFFQIDRFFTPFAAQPAYVFPGVQRQYVANNIQLSTVPRRVYALLRPDNNTLYATPNMTDTYFSIESMNLQFMNVNGIFASAYKQQLHEMAIGNHCDLSWNQWSGGPVQANGGAFSSSSFFTTVGSIACFEFGKDVALPPDMAPGSEGQFTLLLTVNGYNLLPTPVDAVLELIIISEGTFTITQLGHATQQLGVITKMDVINAAKSPYVTYKDVEEVNGGNFLSGLKNFGKNLLKGLRETKAISTGLKALGAIPTPYTQVASQFAPLAEKLGFGEGIICPHCRGIGCKICAGEGVVVGGEDEDIGDMYGDGVVVGGRRLSRRSLKSRLRR